MSSRLHKNKPRDFLCVLCYKRITDGKDVSKSPILTSTGIGAARNKCISSRLFATKTNDIALNQELLKKSLVERLTIFELDTNVSRQTGHALGMALD